MTFPVTEHTVKTARHTTGYLACGAEAAPLLVFCHGWPELSLSWRHQLPAMAALGDVGLAERAQVPAGELAHGEKRALELAIALAMRPKILLLDEPMAGTGREETARLIAVLRRLKGRFSVVLVEHDMTAVFALADRISVLLYGRILASGTAAAVRADARVVAAYLGEEME